jgi:hypothetical protein
VPISILAQRNDLASRYALAAPNAGLATADPGTTGTATTELAASGSPAYARKAIGGNWAAGTAVASAVTGSATFDCYAGVSVAFVFVCVSAVRATADVRDVYDVTDQQFSSQGTYTVTFTYTQT